MIMKGNLLYSQPTNFIVNLIQKYPHRSIPENVFGHHIPGYLDPIKLTQGRRKPQKPVHSELGPGG
jgi:hypothetical protein